MDLTSDCQGKPNKLTAERLTAKYLTHLTSTFRGNALKASIVMKDPAQMRTPTPYHGYRK